MNFDITQYLNSDILINVFSFLTVRDKKLFIFLTDDFYKKLEISRYDFIKQLKKEQDELNYKYMYSFLNSEPFLKSYDLIIQGATNKYIKNVFNCSIAEREIEKGHKDNFIKLLDYIKIDESIFMKLVCTNWLDMVKRVIKYININKCVNGIYPVTMACINSNIDMVCFLIEKGANPNIQNHDGNTALYYASNNMNYDIMELLIPITDLNLKNMKGRSVITDLLISRKFEPLIMLLKCIKIYQLKYELSSITKNELIYFASKIKNLEINTLINSIF